MRYDDEYDYEDDEELTNKLRQEKIMFIVVCGFTILAIAYFLISSLVSSISNTEYDIWKFPLFSGFEDDYEAMSELSDNMGNNGNEWNFPQFDIGGTFVRIDKNTIIINVDNTEKKLTLTGVEIQKNTSLAELLSSRITEGDTLLIDYNKGDSAYVYFENGTMVQNWLLVSGYAKVSKGDFSKKDDFLKSESVAKKNKVGIWKE